MGASASGGRCCCPEQEQFVVGAVESLAENLAGTSPGDATVVSSETPLLGSPATDTAASAASSPSLQNGKFAFNYSTATVKTDKQQLQELVTLFVRHAVKGRPVTLLKDTGMNKIPAVLRLDKDLQEIRIVGQDAHLYMAISDIRDIYSLAQDGKDAFPAAMVSSLNEVDLERLLRVYYKPAGGKTLSFCFLEANLQSCQAFLQSMRVLGERSKPRGGDKEPARSEAATPEAAKQPEAATTKQEEAAKPEETTAPPGEEKREEAESPAPTPAVAGAGA